MWSVITVVAALSVGWLAWAWLDDDAATSATQVVGDDRTAEELFDGDGFRPELAGETVTVRGTVTEIQGPWALQLGTDDEYGGDGILVVAPAMEVDRQLALDDGDRATVAVTGVIRAFDAAAFEDEYGLDADDGWFDVYAGEHVLVAIALRALDT